MLKINKIQLFIVIYQMPFVEAFVVAGKNFFVEMLAVLKKVVLLQPI